MDPLRRRLRLQGPRRDHRMEDPGDHFSGAERDSRRPHDIARRHALPLQAWRPVHRPGRCESITLSLSGPLTDKN